MAKQQNDSQGPPEDSVDGTQDGSSGAGETGKGRPTPKRREAEAANKRPLVPTDRKAAAASDKAKARAARARAQAGLAAGDERYLPARDRGPVRRFVRDYIDARWNVGEFFLPASFVVVLGVLFAGRNATVALASIVLLYVLVFASLIDAYIASRGIKKRVLARFGEVPKGTVSYAMMRAFQIRPSRLPKPQVKRGDRPS